MKIKYGRRKNKKCNIFNSVYMKKEIKPFMDENQTSSKRQGQVYLLLERNSRNYKSLFSLNFLLFD